MSATQPEPQTKRDNAVTLAALLSGVALLWLYLRTHPHLSQYASQLPGYVFPPLLCGGALSVAASLLPHKRKSIFAGAVFLFIAACTVAIAGINGQTATYRIVTGLYALFFIASSVSLGMRILSLLLHKKDEHEDTSSAQPELATAALSFGLGTIIISILTLMLGITGALNFHTGATMLALSLVSGLKPTTRFIREQAKRLKETSENLGGTGWFILGFLLATIAMLLPAAFFPPLDYDVLEYHLQMPKEYFLDGRISFLPHNAFSGFPQGMEMLTLLSFLLAGLERGVWVAKLINFSFLPLMLAAAYASVTSLLSEKTDGKTTRASGLLGAALILACAQTVALSMKLYVELGMGAYTLLALACIAKAWKDKKQFLRWATLAGVFAGGAANCKYTGLLFVGGAVFALLLLPTQKINFKKRCIGAVLAGILCWLVLSPWLIKNASSTGNPFYPIWNSAAGVKDWSDVQETRFYNAHHSTDMSISAMIGEAARVMIGGEHEILGKKVNGNGLGAMGLIFLPCLLLALINKNRKTLALLAWYCACFLLWFFLTHRLERFFHQAYLLSCVCSGLGFAMLSDSAKRIPGRLRMAPPALALCALVCTAMTTGTFTGATYINDQFGTPLVNVLLGKEKPQRVLQRAYAPWMLREWLEAQNAKSASDSAKPHVLLVGTADPFWLPENVEYAMVFSRHPLYEILKTSSTAKDARRKLTERGTTHIYINWSELARLHSTYFKAYELSAPEQKILLELLTKETNRYLPMGPRWQINAAISRGYIKNLAKNYGTLLPGGYPRGYYFLSPYELFELKKTN